MDIRLNQSPDVAERVLERVISTQSDDVFGVRSLGQAKLHLGKPDEAVEYFLQAIKLDPLHGETLFQISMAYRDLGNYHAATMYMFRAIEQNQSAPYWAYMGKLFSEIKEFVPATHYYKKSLSVNPAYLPAHYGLASIYAQQSKWDEFIEEYEWITSSTSLSAIGTQIILYCPKPLMGLFYCLAVSSLSDLYQSENGDPPATEVTGEPPPAGDVATSQRTPCT